MPCGAMLDSVAMDGVVVIGEGEKDEAPMLFNGERIGDGSPPQVDIAVDPLEGTRLTALGMPNAISSDRALGAGHDVRPRAVRVHGEDRRRPGDRRSARSGPPAPGRFWAGWPTARGVDIRDVMVVMLDRERHHQAMG